MDFVKGLAGGDKQGTQAQGTQATEDKTQKSSGGVMDKLNNMAGGGAKGEQKEDALDKGMYFMTRLPRYFCCSMG